MRTLNHAAFEIYYHLTLQIKYRHECLTDEMLTRLESIFRDTLTKWRCSMVEFNGEKDHIHCVFEAHPSLNLSQLVGNLKTVSSRLMRKEYADYLETFFWKPYFWSNSYGLKTLSRGVDLDAIVKYVKNQERPKSRPPLTHD